MAVTAPAADPPPSTAPPPFISGSREVGEGRELTDLEKYKLRVKQLEEQERAATAARAKES